MKAIDKFLSMFVTAGILMFLGLDQSELLPKHMIMITGAACGIINMFIYWLEND